MKNICFLLLLICLAACKEEEKPKTAIKPVQSAAASINKPEPTTENEYYDFSNTVLNEDIDCGAKAYFSGEDAEDIFTLHVPKGNINDTKAKLLVTSAKGTVIYEHIFVTSELINGYDVNKAFIKNEEQMHDYVVKKAKTLLEDAFINPHEFGQDDYFNNAPAEDFDDYEAYKEILSSKRVLFLYTLHEESIYTLGYSLAKNKTVSIISYC